MRELLQQLTEAIKSLSSQGNAPYPHYSEDQVLDNEEVARILHTTIPAIDVYVTKKSLPYYKAGTKRLFFYGEVIKWLKSNECTVNAIDFDKEAEMLKRKKSIESFIKHTRKTKKV